jgi:predicted phage-related endonuclease
MSDDSHLSPERAFRVGSSEVPSLFGHGYLTRLELHMEKAGLAEVDESEAPERLEVGRVIESAIADLVKSRLGLTGRHVRNVYRYIKHRQLPGSGASLDYELACGGLTFPGSGVGLGVLEIKNVSEWAFRKDWERGEVLPLRYALQVQQQLSVTGRSWGLVAALVGGNHLHLHPVTRHQGAIERIENEIPKFWQAVNEGKPPSPDWEKDSPLVIRIRSLVDDELTIDLSTDDDANQLARNFAQYRSEANAAKKLQTQAKAMLLEFHVGEASRVQLADGGYITRKKIDDTEVPQHTRKGYTNFNCKIKEKT